MLAGFEEKFQKLKPEIAAKRHKRHKKEKSFYIIFSFVIFAHFCGYLF
jgi:hypothetical protein